MAFILARVLEDRGAHEHLVKTPGSVAPCEKVRVRRPYTDLEGQIQHRLRGGEQIEGHRFRGRAAVGDLNALAGDAGAAAVRGDPVECIGPIHLGCWIGEGRCSAVCGACGRVVLFAENAVAALVHDREVDLSQLVVNPLHGEGVAPGLDEAVACRAGDIFNHNMVGGAGDQGHRTLVRFTPLDPRNRDRVLIRGRHCCHVVGGHVDDLVGAVAVVLGPCLETALGG